MCYKVVRAYVEVVGGNNVVAILDAEKLNKGFLVFCNVKLKRMNKEILVAYCKRLGFDIYSPQFWQSKQSVLLAELPRNRKK